MRTAAFPFSPRARPACRLTPVLVCSVLRVAVCTSAAADQLQGVRSHVHAAVVRADLMLTHSLPRTAASSGSEDDTLAKTQSSLDMRSKFLGSIGEEEEEEAHR